jgi:TonB-linked SusC/RagA family outer membrane protein
MMRSVLTAAITAAVLSPTPSSLLAQSSFTFASDRAGALDSPVTRAEASPARIAGTVSGRVTDQSSGTPVAAAAVTILASGLGAATDDDGRYRITGVPSGTQTVVVRRIGYAQVTKTVSVTDGGTMTADFALVRSATQLEAVVATATGEERKLALAHTIGVVRADSLLREAPVTNISDALTSRVAGVMVNGQNGLTGTVSPIRIRGLNSFTLSNNPIVIVDGARIEATPSTSTTAASRLGDLNLGEVESIEVVKGPSAATLYGTDAANGVLLIRTKRGEAGAPRWLATGEAGTIHESTSLMPTSYYAWGHSPTNGAKLQCPLVIMVTGACVQDSITTFSPLKNPDTTPITDGNRQQIGLQTSGGVAQFRYFASGDVDKELGFEKMPNHDVDILSKERGTAIPEEQLRPNYQRKVNVRGNVTYSLGDNADLQLSNSAITSYFRAGTTEAFRAGYWSLGYRDPANDGWAFGERIGDYFSVRNAEYLTRYLSSLGGNWRPTRWLSTRATLGYDFSNNVTDRLQRNGEGPLSSGQRLGSRTQTDNAITQYSFDAGATATTTLTSSFGSRLSVGAQYNRRAQVQTTLTGTSLPPGSETVAGAATLTGSELHADAIVVGSYIEEQISYKERIFATAAYRADGASTFGRDLHTTIYPKYGLSWILSEQPGVPKIPGIGVLRARVAYGASGVQPPSIAGITTITLSNAAINAVTVSAATLGATSAGSAGAFGNPSVRPERQSEIEGGVDFEAWNSRVRVEATYYSRLSTDALVAAPYAASVGAGSRYANIGSVSNKGGEGLVTVRLVDRPNVAFDLAFNGSIQNNKLVSVGPDAPPGFFANYTFIGARHRVGYPLYGGWQKPILGYKDTNGDGVLAPSEVQVGDTEVYIGPSLPTKQATVTPALSLLKDRVHISALFDWRGGYMRYDYTRGVGCQLLFNCPEAVDPKAPLAMQAAMVAKYTGAYSTNWGFYSDGAYTRLRELSVTLQLPDRVLRSTRSRGGTFTVSGRNLWLHSKFTGGDPEVNVSTGGDLNYTFPTPPIPAYYIARFNLQY